MRTNANTWAVAAALLLGACAGAPASPEQQQLAERRLLSPYLQNRTVACNELVVEITPNFHMHVSNPGVDPNRHRFERIEQQAQVDKVWTNLTGDRSGWFTVTIGEPADPTEVGARPGPRTTFTVMNQFTLRVRERGEMALSATAEGPILMVQEVGAAPRDVRAFSIVDGVMKF
ncbi:MAG: hypothetical protein KAI24_11800 [Planctomycetes bacterium]|nr:hypothetical protein [Planctomycetota bacterium]